MSISNFQDVVALSSDTLNAYAERIVIGSSAGSKSVVFAQDKALVSAMHLVASNPTAQLTQILPDANGTIGFLTGISAGVAAFSNGTIVFSNSNVVWGINGSTITAGLSKISNLEVGLYFATAGGTLTSATTTASAAAFTLTASAASGVRVSAIYPIDVTYIDPKGQAQGELSIVPNASSMSATASYSWWCGIYTINGSTAGVVSSTSNSTSLTFTRSQAGGTSSSVAIDMRFTNITWNITPGDYMFFTGANISLSGTMAGTLSVTIDFAQTQAGHIPADASYSVPYWGNGVVTLSATSYHLSKLVNSSGVGVLNVVPYARMIGS